MRDPNRVYWNEQFKILQDTWPKPINFEECINICLKLHAMVHQGVMSQQYGLWSFEDELWNGLTEEAFRRTIPGEQSIAWKIWHSTRIEDMTMNILIAGNNQIYVSDGWKDKLSASVDDTGNAMNNEDISEFSMKVNMEGLKYYRLEVGNSTAQIIKGLQPADLKCRVEPNALQRVADEGAVVQEAKWLLDYWNGKTVAGLLLMPATRHNLVHLNESIRIK